MKLLTDDIRERLLQNGRLMQEFGGTENEPDFLPVVKLFTPDATCTWLLTELDPADPDTLSACTISAWAVPNSARCGFRKLNPCGAGSTKGSLQPTKSPLLGGVENSVPRYFHNL